MRNKFDQQLEQLHLELIKMGALCEEAISASVKALLDGDQSMAEKSHCPGKGHRSEGAGHREPVHEAAAPAAAGGP